MTRRLHRWGAPLLIGLLSLLIYSINLERPPHIDELYHMLAAQGLLEHGEPVIGEDGRYWRGYPVTWLVAQSMKVLGPTLTAGRLPSVLFMALASTLLFLFLRRETDALSAWIGAGLFAVSPFAIDMAQYVRFYGMQTFVFFTGAWLAYDLTGRPWTLHRHGPLIILAALLLAFSAYLQQVSLLGIAGLGLWIAGALTLPWIFAPDRPARQSALLIVAIVLAGCVVLAGLAATGLLAGGWAEFRAVQVFNEPNADRFWYYHARYILFYPTLWSLVGVLTVCALINKPRPASFALVVFAVGFLLNSAAGPKSLRYIIYAQPFLFILWGMGLGYVFKSVAPGFVGQMQRALSSQLLLLPAAWSANVARSLVFGALFFVVLANPAWLRSITLIADINVPPELPSTDWPAAYETLQPWLDEVEVFVVAEELGPLFYYDRADILLHPSKFAELPPDERVPFTPDYRTDVPSIPDAASLELVLDCHASGLFLIEEKFWGIGAVRMRDPEVEALLMERATPLPLRPESRLLAFTWETEVAPEMAETCRRVPTVGH